jgi:hypothetical protein
MGAGFGEPLSQPGRLRRSRSSGKNSTREMEPDSLVFMERHHTEALADNTRDKTREIPITPHSLPF